MTHADQVLSSDILEAQFGPTHVHIYKQTQFERVITTQVVATGQVLEVSRVQFAIGALDRYPQVAQDMANGMSLGVAFRSNNIAYNRRETSRYTASVGLAFRELFAAPDPCTLVDVTWYAEGQVFATILELYSSAVHWPDSLPAAHHSDSSPKHQHILESLVAYTSKQ